MKNLKYFIISFFMLGAYISASAYDFSSLTRKDDALALDSVRLYYSINPDGATVSVTQGPATYNFGSAEIPETVTYEGKTYTVTEIANSAFAKSRINTIIMPNTITIIYDAAFGESSVVNVTFSKGLKKICKSAFGGSNIREAILPEGLETIEEYAFVGKSGGYHYIGQMKSVVLPTSLKYIGNDAFNGQAFNKVVIPDNIAEIKDYTFNYCTNLDTVVLPKNLQSIGNYAFAYCALQKIDADFFPATLSSIGNSAFSGNDKLKSVILPAQVKSIGTYLFYDCDILESIEFSPSLTNLPDYVCGTCPQLVNVKIPEGITEIGNNAFYHCSRLSSIDLPESLTTIGEDLFSNSGLTKFTFPSKLEYVGVGMFEYCKQLTEITIPETVKRFETETNGDKFSSAFMDCRSLTSVNLPSHITYIPSGAFTNCSNLESIVLPDSLKTLDGAFASSGLKTIVIPEGVETLGNSVFNSCKSLTSVTLPKNLKTIESSVFYGCTALETIDLPMSLEFLGDYSFRFCSSLKSITLYHNVKTIGRYCFDGCTSLEAVHYKRAIPSSVSDVIRENTCTLYVPTGSKATYEATQGWSAFDTIMEEEIGYDILYRVSASKTGQGSIAINGETKTSVDILSGTKVGVTFTPASGWKLKSVVLNDKDVTASLVDNEYVIDDLDANMVFVAMFEELPAILSLRSADGGSIDVPVEKGKTFSCVFTPDENWSINNVRYNNADVTLSVSESGEYTTPVIKYDATLSVAYETGDNSVEAIGVDADMKAYVLSDGLLVVEGTMHGMPVVVYDADGKVLSSLVTVDGRCSYQLPDAGVYLVKGISKTIKVVY
ncbi:MAG: leucine-rich repeat domain-containing protein [Bacteroidales bacterium]|nr:leucine-rich repeat domain-containing protein [Bacteroidales bacterium]